MTQKEYYEKLSAAKKELAYQLRFEGDEDRACEAYQQHQAIEQKLAEMSETEKQALICPAQKKALERTRDYAGRLARESAGETDESLDVLDHPNDCPYLYKKATARPVKSAGRRQ